MHSCTPAILIQVDGFVRCMRTKGSEWANRWIRVLALYAMQSLSGVQHLYSTVVDRSSTYNLIQHSILWSVGTMPACGAVLEHAAKDGLVVWGDHRHITSPPLYAKTAQQHSNLILQWRDHTCSYCNSLRSLFLRLLFVSHPDNS